MTWISLGDANTKYFSDVMKEKQRKQILNLTSIDGTNLKEAEDIKLEIVQFYKGLMGTAVHSLPAVNAMIMQQGPVLSNVQQYELNKAFTDAEIQEGLNQIGSDKSAGVDGYNATFYKAALPVIKEDIIAAVQEFLCTGEMFKPINCTAVTLLPKTGNPITIRDFKPIACCTVLYKVISKVLARRIQKVIANIICEAQARFIPGRKIGDNVILAHELVQAYTRKHISPRCMLKIDLQNAYDSVEWVYLRQILENMKFHTEVIGWITEFVQTVSYTISINGKYIAPFAAAKGLRQGDPMSPYLFANAMEYLSGGYMNCNMIRVTGIILSVIR